VNGGEGKIMNKKHSSKGCRLIAAQNLFLFYGIFIFGTKYDYPNSDRNQEYPLPHNTKYTGNDKGQNTTIGWTCMA